MFSFLFHLIDPIGYMSFKIFGPQNFSSSQLLFLIWNVKLWWCSILSFLSWSILKHFVDFHDRKEIYCDTFNLRKSFIILGILILKFKIWLKMLLFWFDENFKLQISHSKNLISSFFKSFSLNYFLNILLILWRAQIVRRSS